MLGGAGHVSAPDEDVASSAGVWLKYVIPARQRLYSSDHMPDGASIF